MNKIQWIIVLVLCAFILTACGARAPEAVPAPTATPEPPSTVPDPSMAPGGIRFTADAESEDFYDEDTGTLLLSFSCAKPVAEVGDRDAATAAINAVLETDYLEFVQGAEDQAEYNISGKEAFLAAAREEFTYWQESDNPDGFIPYLLQRRVAVQRGDAAVLSIVYDDTTWTGGAHGYILRTGKTFDARTGQVLGLADLTDDPEAFATGCAEKLLEISRSEDYVNHTYNINYEKDLPALVRDGNWYFDSEGLVIVANPYDIATYADGCIEFQLPYSWLSGQLKPEYMPSAVTP